MGPFIGKDEVPAAPLINDASAAAGTPGETRKQIFVRSESAIRSEVKINK